ncbi:MAG: YtxH domain-containing protein [Dysgonamonadaceae bacterium]|jgi:gas vesicle protein|nr:YtxH domain-containing protein [Dysgonamonadaceae bacterium]
MKTKYYLGGLVLGALVGGAIGYMIASDPKKRAIVQRFFDDIESNIEEKIEKVKAKFSEMSGEEWLRETISNAVD